MHKVHFLIYFEYKATVDTTPFCIDYGANMMYGFVASARRRLGR
jgi:hypothetical protein